MFRLGALARAVVCAGLAILVLAPSAFALDEVDTKKLRDAVTVNGILGHERALQRIANLNGGTRASGTPGFEASLNYVKGRLDAAGYKTTVQEFTFPFFRELAPATLAQVSPTPKTYTTATYDFSGTGDVTGTLVPATNNQSPPGPTPGSSSAGCAAGDFPAASPADPQIALVQRGTCTFEEKAANAQAAGYDAVIIYNEGQPGRTDLFVGTLGRIFTIPVVGLSFADGDALNAQAKTADVTMHVTTSTENNPNARTWNLLADSKGGDKDQTIVVGSHLDSVVAGPGINDNGSGSASDLEVALQIAKLKLQPRRHLRFAFWGAEEAGLLGSEHYVANLPDTELTQIYANLNFDMVASPNYVRFVYDGDGSDTPDAGPPGSAQIENVFNGFYASQGLATDPTAFDGRSDYGPFIEVGIPAGGLFTGAEGVKTAEQAAVYGGTAGVAYDHCYHQACDTINDLNTKGLSEMSDGIADAAWTIAKSKTGFFEDQSLTARKKGKGVKTRMKGPEALR
jgi:Zn-dependent M28 family amino/carboxypeptidase